MTLLTILQFIVNIILVLFLISILIIGGLLLFKDKRQKQHSVLRNYPLLARVRYFFEKIGPEMRQYFIFTRYKR
ncbi:glutamate synthase [Staphylococcus gallinarum]|uniref:Glutamate synthase n=1 Tax=Staphylococcus gallinarum TaxID=1293 RepID=A0A380FMI3_STAGA|nr:glutamate synthase [Staphylococcus gallinarum]